MKKGIKIKINNVFYGDVTSEGEAISVILASFLPDYHFMRMEGIKQHLISLSEMIDEIQEKQTAKIQRLTKSMRKIANEAKEKAHLLTFVTNLILRGEGLGLFPGFGVAKIEMNEGHAKIKARLWIDPEKQSIREVY